jgi:hypothetical protein
MRRLVVFLAILAAGCVGPSPRWVAVPTPGSRTVVPAYEQEMDFYLPSYGVQVIYALGEITPNTPARFEAFEAAHPEWRGGVLVLDSPGGNLYASLQLGDAIRRGGWSTLVGMQYGQPVTKITTMAACASACVYTFAGGVNRFVLTDNVLGVHQFFGPGGSATAQQTVVMINLYLDRMGVSRALQDVAGLTPSATVTRLTIADAVKLRLGYITPEAAKQIRRFAKR